jgi:hypothetical protein
MEIAKMKNNALLQRILSAKSYSPDDVPKGFKTAREYAADWGVRERRTREILQSGIRDGVVEAKSFRIATGVDGRLCPVPHYREKR